VCLISTGARSLVQLRILVSTLHRKSGHLFLCRVEVWLVCARSRVRRSLPDVLADKRLAVEFEAHAVSGCLTYARPDFIAVGARIFVVSKIAALGLAERPAGHLLL